MKIRSGHIPADILYIFAGHQKVTNKWDDADQNDDELKYTQVIPAFVSDADNEKTIATGRQWSNARCSIYDHKTNKAVKTAVVQELQRENTPMENIRIVSLEHRGNGGRAYKVVTKDDYYFDLREDVLLDTMLTEGIAPGGILKGKYLWARVAAEMKLVRVGSELYTALLEAGERAIMSSVPKGKLSIGTVYETKQGERGIFLGYVQTEDWTLKWPNGKSTWSNRYITPVNGKAKDKPTLASRSFKKHLLWFKISPYSYVKEKTDPSIKLLTEALAKPDLDYNFSLSGSHSMVKTITSIPVPADIIEQVRLKAVLSYESRMVQQLNKKNPNSRSFYSPMIYEYEKEEIICNASAMCLMRVPGQPAPKVEEANFELLSEMIGQVLQ